MSVFVCMHGPYVCDSTIHRYSGDAGRIYVNTKERPNTGIQIERMLLVPNEVTIEGCEFV